MLSIAVAVKPPWEFALIIGKFSIRQKFNCIFDNAENVEQRADISQPGPPPPPLLLLPQGCDETVRRSLHWRRRRATSRRRGRMMMPATTIHGYVWLGVPSLGVAAAVVVGWDVYWKTKFTYLPSRGRTSRDFLF